MASRRQVGVDEMTMHQCVTSANRSRSPRSTSGSVRSIPGAEVRSETQSSKRQPSAAGPRKRWCRGEDDAVRMAGSLFPTPRVVPSHYSPRTRVFNGVVWGRPSNSFRFWTMQTYGCSVFFTLHVVKGIM